MNTFKNIPTDIQAKADEIIEQLDLEGCIVSYNSAQRAIHFKKNFKEMTVPLALVERRQWADIRQIQQAVFQPGPQVENFGAGNEWGRGQNKG